MAVPDFQALMLPLLSSMADGEQHTLPEARQALAESLALPEADLKELLPSGKQTVWVNRVAWACVYLQRAGLLLRPSRGVYQISAEGQSVLKSGPDKIDIAFLKKYPSFVKFQTSSSTEQATEEGGKEAVSTPRETLEAAHEQLRDDLMNELVNQIQTCSYSFFECLVVELLLAMGYGGSRKDAGMAVGGGGDEGIDGIIKDDRLGLDLIYIQAKRWQGTVGRPEIQKFVGALHGKHTRKGVFMTTATFTKQARDYAAAVEANVVLLDGRELAELMIDYGLGVTTQASYEVKAIDSDFFVEDA